MSKIAEEVEKLVTPIVESFGCELVEVEFAKKYNGDNLTVFIDKKGGVTLVDCEAVHNAIDLPLDELDPTHGKPYTLNVSSPGIDRPIVTDKDYSRNVGEMLEVKLFQAIEKKKVFVGALLSFDENTITLEIDGNSFELERKMISKATKFIEF